MPMNPPIPFPLLNGHELSRTSVSMRLGGAPGGFIPIIGWTSLNFETVRAPGMSHGSRSKPQARTRGKVTFPADLTVYERDWNAIRTFLDALGLPFGMGWSEVSSHLSLTYFEPSMGPGVFHVELVGMQVLSAKQAISDSDDQLARNLTLSVMDILEDGLSGVRENTAPGF